MIKAILPSSIPLSRLDVRAPLKALHATSEAMKVDFSVTTFTWNKRPAPKVTALTQTKHLVSIADQVYYYVNHGTRPHRIYPVKAKALRFQVGYKAKTSFTRLSSGKGGPFGATVYRKYVRHPGTKPRFFDRRIAQKWIKQFPIIMERTIRRSAKST